MISLLFTGLLLSVIVSSCKPAKTFVQIRNANYLPIKKGDFITNSFGYEANVKNFTKNLVPPLKIQKFVKRNIHNPSQNDTIIKFYKGKTQLFIYKTKFKQEMFFAGVIYDKRLIMTNGIKVGMKRSDFFKAFTDLNYSDDDTVKIKLVAPADGFQFIFNKDKIKFIVIQHYID
jgi:hypothetical protein